jgi:hypothetical protein
MKPSPTIPAGAVTSFAVVLLICAIFWGSALLAVLLLF